MKSPQANELQCRLRSAFLSSRGDIYFKTHIEALKSVLREEKLIFHLEQTEVQIVLPTQKSSNPDRVYLEGQEDTAQNRVRKL